MTLQPAHVGMRKRSISRVAQMTNPTTAHRQTIDHPNATPLTAIGIVNALRDGVQTTHSADGRNRSALVDLDIGLRPEQSPVAV